MLYKTQHKKKNKRKMVKIDELKNKIEKIDEIHQLHIASILRQHPEIKLNSNKSGILVNLSTIPEPILEEIEKYMDYAIEQEKTLIQVENKTENLKQQFLENKF
jgi:hypothetical protein